MYKRIVIYLIFIPFQIVFFNCSSENIELYSSLKISGENRKELEEVLRHYSLTNDSLKYKAACFLINNMRFHTWKIGLNNFNTVFDSVSKIQFKSIRQEVFTMLLDSVAKISTNYQITVIKDVETMTAKDIIENIDLAFEAWYKHPTDKRADFESFCNFILPYRNSDEPFEPGQRKRLMEKYFWVFDSLEENVSLKKIADEIISNLNTNYVNSIRTKYPMTLSISQFEKSRLGTCGDEANYVVFLFRALGIVSSEDFTPHWGNHPSLGHSWFRLEYNGETYSKYDELNIYKEESIPKVFRRTYSRNIDKNYDGNYIDVTNEYKRTVNTKTKIIFMSPNNAKNPVLCVFDVNKQWAIVTKGIKNDNYVQFKEIGTNVLYLAANYVSGLLNPVNYPFFLSLNGSITYLEPKSEVYDSIILLRKAGFKSSRSMRNQDWLDSLNNGIFQGSNNKAFNNAETLGKIESLKSTHVQQFIVNSSNNFKYIRFYSEKKRTFLALLEFYNKRGEKLSGSVMKTNCIKSVLKEGAFDDDPLTYTGGNNISLGLSFQQPQKIGFIKFQARNDDNDIRIGDKYELFFWDKVWKSLGIQTASDTMLIYKNIPKNSLLWLRDLTRGKEENPFTINSNENQFFFGFIND